MTWGTARQHPLKAAGDLKKVIASTVLKGKSHLCIPFLGIPRPQFKFPHVSVCDLYIPRIGPHISLQQNSRPIREIYKSLTDI
jgi:hypothetical protein